MSKVFVLTHCSAEKNHTPLIFKNKDDALKHMRIQFYESIYITNKSGDTELSDFVKYHDICGDNAEITYVDDTYDVWEIFEVEVK